jgi:hypothetical protein
MSVGIWLRRAFVLGELKYWVKERDAGALIFNFLSKSFYYEYFLTLLEMLW